MAMKIKDTKTSVVAWSVSMLHCHRTVARVWPKWVENDTPIISGAQEFGHGEGSQHYGVKSGGYECEAADYDSPNLHEGNAEKLALALRKELGEAYQVLIAWRAAGQTYYTKSAALKAQREHGGILHVTHIHTEHDPRR